MTHSVLPGDAACLVHSEEPSQCTGVVRGSIDSRRAAGGCHAANRHCAAIGGHGRQS
jgi:hypothetical protein